VIRGNAMAPHTTVDNRCVAFDGAGAVSGGAFSRPWPPNASTLWSWWIACPYSTSSPSGAGSS